MEDKSIFITGNSSGLGYGLSKYYVEKNTTVYGISRRGCHSLKGKVYNKNCDLANFADIPAALSELLGKLSKLDLVILNAGILGQIKDLHKTSLNDIQEVMNINVWANKIILDWLLEHGMEVTQIVLISSGASVNGNRGWNAYSLSKATLNMLTKLYAHEFPNTHLGALAPGLIHTAIQDFLCKEVDTQQFPSIQNLKNAFGTESMPGEIEAGHIIANAIERLPSFDSGSFIDARNLTD